MSSNLPPLEDARYVQVDVGGTEEQSGAKKASKMAHVSPLYLGGCSMMFHGFLLFHVWENHSGGVKDLTPD